MLSIGIDAHQGTYAVCILDDNGKVVKEHTVRGGAGDVAGWLKGRAAGPNGGPMAVCYEASLGYGTLHDALAPVAASIQVAHPAKVRTIFKSKTKNDRIDARKLAKLVYLDEVPRVHVPTLDVREWRVLIEHRRRTVDKRTATKNGLRSVLRGQGIAMPKGKRLWSAAGIEWLRGMEFASPLTALRRDQLVRDLEHFSGAIRLVEKMLDGIAAKHAGVSLLMTIPGVGPRTAEAVAAYIDRPERFGSTRRVASYFGLVPCLDESASRSRYGHITKEGPATARKYLVEASWQAVRHTRMFKAFFERIRAGKKERRALALVATARHLVRVMAAMMLSGEQWRDLPENPETKAA